MNVPSIWRTTQHWVSVDELRTLGVKNNGDMEEKKTDVLPQGTDTLEVQQRGDWLWYRLRDSGGVIIEVGSYPPNMVVYIKHTV